MKVETVNIASQCSPWDAVESGLFIVGLQHTFVQPTDNYQRAGIFHGVETNNSVCSDVWKTGVASEMCVSF